MSCEHGNWSDCELCAALNVLHAEIADQSKAYELLFRQHARECKPVESLTAERGGLAKELAELRAQEPAAVPEMVRAELQSILDYVEVEMHAAYNNGFLECCGRGRNGECCGDPNAAWHHDDQLTMDKLSTVQSRLHALLAAAQEEGK